MKLFHFTTALAAEAILKHGFRDSPGDMIMPAGVWFSDSSDANHRAMGKRRTVMLEVDLPDAVARRHLAAEFAGWREYCVPAEVVNMHPAVHRTADIGA